MSRKQGIIIDSFAGGGGASLGIAWALGRAPDIAINHDAVALAVHAENHPSTKHICEDVFQANIRKIVGRRGVYALWASPDCRDFSRAKGDKPVSKNIRSLAWVIVKWVVELGPKKAPKIIFLENVREFADWGPVVPAWRCAACDWRGTEGQAKLVRVRRRCPRCNSLRLRMTDKFLRDPKKKGITFKRWCGRLRNLGYHLQFKVLNASDFGAPTHRRRLFMVARRDGKPIAWPEHSHGNPKKLDSMPLFNILKPWRTAAECIDWTIPCKSIFERDVPLVPNTERRVAMAIKRYVLENPQPFLVPITHGGERRSYSIDEPLPTVTTAHRGELAIAVPHLIRFNTEKSPGDLRAQPLTDPLSNLDTQNRFAMVAPTLVQTGYSERDGQSPRALDIGNPLGTIVSGGKHALVAAMLIKHFGGMVGAPADTPLPTTTARGTQNQLATATLVRFNFDDAGVPIEDPIPTITSNNHAGVVAASLVRMNHGDKQWNGVDEPLVTVTSANHAALVYAFLIRYFGTAIGQHVTEPLFTITGKDRFGLVLVKVHSEWYFIADICMRMLAQRELARAQGFPDTYVLERANGQPITKTKQTELIGNSVSPYPAKALVEVNCLCPMQAA